MSNEKYGTDTIENEIHAMVLRLHRQRAAESERHCRIELRRHPLSRQVQSEMSVSMLNGKVMIQLYRVDKITNTEDHRKISFNENSLIERQLNEALCGYS